MENRLRLQRFVMVLSLLFLFAFWLSVAQAKPTLTKEVYILQGKFGEAFTKPFLPSELTNRK